MGIKNQEKKDKMDHQAAIETLSGYGRSLFDEEVKWYNYEEQMKAYSKMYPELLFIINGQGEEHDDLFNAYFKDGKVQKCSAIITFDEYDESKLK